MAAALILSSLAPLPPAFALTDEEIYSALRLPVVLPGARTAAMGRAGLALVDDPAALRINPARLAALGHRQGAFELRRDEAGDQSGRSSFVASDPGGGNPFAGARAASSSREDAGYRPLFLGYAHPLELLGRPLVAAVGRTEALDAALTARTTSTVVPISAPVAPDSGAEVTLVSEGSLQARVALWEAGAGWRITPSFAAGAALSFGTLDLNASTTGSLSDPLQLTGPGMVDPRFGAPVPSPLRSTRTSGSDTDLAVSFGAWWKPASALSVATVFRQGARFDLEGRSRDQVPGGSTPFSTRLELPDTAAVGLAWTPLRGHPSAALQSLTLVLDVERVSRGGLASGVREGVNVLTSPMAVRTVTYESEDVTEARLGVEVRRSLPSWTLAVRGGLYTERVSAVRAVRIAGDVPPLEGHAEALSEAGFFEDEDDELHATLGAGFAFYALTLDLGADLSGEGSRFTASASYRFGR
ncbi:MAG TPA: hypothetical protein VJV23_11960 [Candidatus Polarisedimenticolia bacterium]|nr:hypothetical protein [Candidatus Polarisedimenticolia bacterium]